MEFPEELPKKFLLKCSNTAERIHITVSDAIFNGIIDWIYWKKKSKNFSAFGFFWQLIHTRNYSTNITNICTSYNTSYFELTTRLKKLPSFVFRIIECGVNKLHYFFDTYFWAKLILLWNWVCGKCCRNTFEPLSFLDIFWQT